MERAAAAWRYGHIHEDAPFHDGTFPEDLNRWSATRTTETPYHYSDGVTVWVSARDLAPEDDFLHTATPGTKHDSDEGR